MMQWMNPRASRACLFGALLAAVTACDDRGPEEPTSTFGTAANQLAQQPEIAQPNVAANPTEQPPATGPVVGTVAPVPAAQLPELIDKPLPVVPPVLSAADTATARFLSVAPDTFDTGKYKSSLLFTYELGRVFVQPADSIEAKDPEYELAKRKGIPFGLIAPIRGSIRYPEEVVKGDGAKYPLIVFLHGQHNGDVSHLGYDYLGKDLVTQGYVVVSIDADTINMSMQTGMDGANRGRAQLMLATLDKLRQVNETGQVDGYGNPGILNVLKGKLDFDRLGIMGHSRGGMAIGTTLLQNVARKGTTFTDLKNYVAEARASLINFSYTGYFHEMVNYPDIFAATTTTTNADGKATATVDEAKLQAAAKKYGIGFVAGDAPPYKFKGAFLLAPTQTLPLMGISDVPFATLVGSCDGDVQSLSGLAFFDRNRYSVDKDPSSHYQLWMRGANHNFFSTEWRERDTLRSGCAENHILLNEKEQRRAAHFIINSYMRYHVGGEQKFANYWNGLARFPSANCPAGQGTCDESIVLSIQKSAKDRVVIQRFDQKTPEEAKTNRVGGAFVMTGFDKTALCPLSMEQWYYRKGGCLPKALTNFEYIGSATELLQVSWNAPGAKLTTDLKNLSTAGMDYLTFRVAVTETVGQEILVSLTDSNGKTATVTASDYTDALYDIPRPKAGMIPMVDNPADLMPEMSSIYRAMNMVAIPLSAFKDIDTTKLSALQLEMPREKGGLAINDIELQNFGRAPKPATTAQN
ncbi:hypothetical protein HQ945_07270 [Phyllobacterium sp. BT25]|uniref:Alpha/beta hydrolase n=1 Tax=Phyllobacterium pellucidum TaxID=2740464 RepID=A0A849VMK1_9HYPH|nr:MULTISPECIES: hypothetical protein [Phyllobacterium]NTS31051.1 hypothetical protein [Phyllobacterium pellucidum]UGY10353.1 hypothetical protein LLE51_003970 [Phyllobacterium sp. T1018]